MSMTARIYVDGQNLFFGCLQGGHRRRYRWLDLKKLSKHAFPNDKIASVSYFTAPITAPRRSENLERQRYYLKALRLKGVSVEEGFHKDADKPGEKIKPVPPCGLCDPKPPEVPMVTARIRVEKCTDVNLAIHLLRDAYAALEPTRFVIMSKDNDYLGLIRLFKEQFPQHQIAMVFPVVRQRWTAEEFRRLGVDALRRALGEDERGQPNWTFIEKEEWLLDSQFPEEVRGTLNGKPATVLRPVKWASL